jgi:hypothetical protein
MLTGKVPLTEIDAVEEAFCFDRIDSTVKRLDAEQSDQRFSQRNPKSPYYQTDKQRPRWLIEHIQITLEILATLNDNLATGYETLVDFLQALKTTEQAWRNFHLFSGFDQRIPAAF